MAVYYIGSYDIVNPEQFQHYPPKVAALLPTYGGQVLASDTSAYVLEGQARTMNAIIRFPSREAALGLYDDPAYQEAKRIRQGSTTNSTMVLAAEFVGADTRVLRPLGSVVRPPNFDLACRMSDPRCRMSD